MSKYPPIYPINHNINTYDNFINSNSKKDLKLYRKRIYLIKKILSLIL